MSFKVNKDHTEQGANEEFQSSNFISELFLFVHKKAVTLFTRILSRSLLRILSQRIWHLNMTQVLLPEKPQLREAAEDQAHHRLLRPVEPLQHLHSLPVHLQHFQ